MGDEAVLVCSAQGGEWYWNNGKQPEKLKDIEAKKMTKEDGKILCEIETNMVFEIKDKPVDFTKEVSVSITSKLKFVNDVVVCYHIHRNQICIHIRMCLHQNRFRWSPYWLEVLTVVLPYTTVKPVVCLIPKKYP